MAFNVKTLKRNKFEMIILISIKIRPLAIFSREVAKNCFEITVVQPLKMF